MSRAFRTYALIVGAAGAASLAGLVLLGGGVVWDWRLLLLGIPVVITELLPIDVPRREGLDRVTTSTAFAFATLLVLGPAAAALTLAGASLLADLAVARLPLVKAWFNAAQYLVCLAAATLVVGAAGTHPPLADLQPHLLAVGLGCLTFLVANHVLAGVAAALLAREPVGRYLVSDLPFQVITALCVLALTPVVVASAPSR